MHEMPTPLRYPGGKQRIWRTIADIIVSNGLEGCEYVEPYAGGAGVALELLEHGVVSKIHINDINPIVSNFWKTILRSPEEICSLVLQTPVTVSEWDHQKSVMKAADSSPIEKAFAFLFLNRTSFSGIIDGGIIGGRKQLGKYKIGARYPQEKIARYIANIAANKKKIKVYSSDASKFLIKIDSNPKDTFIYCDPPYYVKGRQLYLDYYQHEHHVEIANILRRISSPWIVSYDNVKEIRLIYKDVKNTLLELPYCARNHSIGKEILFYSENVSCLPKRRN